jgi:hypothetical protein
MQLDEQAWRPAREWTYSLGEVGDEVVPVLCLLETSESHLGSGNVLFGQSWSMEGVQDKKRSRRGV